MSPLQIHRLVSFGRSLVLLVLVAFAVLGAVPSARAAAVFEQEEIRVTKSDPFLYMPSDQVWDLLPYKHLVVKFKVTGVSLDATKYVRVYIQTNASLENEDWQDVEFAPFVQGTDTAPDINMGLINIEDTVPLSRYVRWRVAFESATSTQYVTFSIVGVARE